MLVLAMVFVDIAPEQWVTKVKMKTNKHDYNKSKSFCWTKEPISKIELQSVSWEKIICQSCIQKGLAAIWRGPCGGSEGVLLPIVMEEPRLSFQKPVRNQILTTVRWTWKWILLQLCFTSLCCAWNLDRSLVRAKEDPVKASQVSWPTKLSTDICMWFQTGKGLNIQNLFKN